MKFKLRKRKAAVPQLTQAKFLGIAPNIDAFSGQAYLAENVDLSGGGLRSVKAPAFEEAGHSGEIVKHDGIWYSGKAAYISTDISGIPALIYKTLEGQWKLEMNHTSSMDLWMNPPTAFTVESSLLPTPEAPLVTNDGNGNIAAGDYEYFATIAQYNTSGELVRESLPSGAGEITVTGGLVKCLRPQVSNLPQLCKWRVYRRPTGGTYARLAGEVSMTQAVFYDSKATSALGTSIYPESVSAVTRDYKYVIVWVRNIAGYIQESVPSAIYGVHQDSDGVQITLLETPPEGVTGWRIYRISIGADLTTTFQLVEDLPIETTEYLDIKENVNLGDAMKSSYRADNGALVTAGIPDDQFTGMAGPFNGFFVGWIGRDLYLSQPGNPSWWPGAFVVQANHPITTVTQTGGNLAVVTTGGVQLGYGVTPDAFALSQSIFGQGSANALGADKNFYIGYDGVYTVNENGAELLSLGFDKEYLEDTGAINGRLIQEKDKLFLFYSSGALVYDFRTGQWTTLSAEEHSFDSVYVDGGEIYGSRQGSIVKLFGSDDDTTMDYEGTADFSDSATKRIESMRLYGSGSARVELKSIEDTATILTDGTVNMASGYEPDRTVYAPAWLNTEALRYRITGKGAIRSMMFEVEKGSTES